MIKIDLPKEPVDGYQVKYGRLSLSSYWCYINETVATYHVATAWGVYAPTQLGGADIVDQWMININGYDEGRCSGWDGLKGLASQKDVFPSREAAVIEARVRLDEDIARTEQHVLDLKKLKIAVSA